MAGGLEQALLGDVRGGDEQEALLLVPLPDVVLHHPPDDPALGVEDGQARADLVGEGEQVELGAQLAVVALLRLREPVQVVLERVAGLPRGAVDALQLRVLLAPPPVGGGDPHQLERRDVPGRRHVRTAAQVLPRQRAVLAQVVVDGQLAAADLGRRRRPPASAALVP